jgi:hypothetical protein
MYFFNFFIKSRKIWILSPPLICHLPVPVNTSSNSFFIKAFLNYSLLFDLRIWPHLASPYTSLSITLPHLTLPSLTLPCLSSPYLTSTQQSYHLLTYPNLTLTCNTYLHASTNYQSSCVPLKCRSISVAESCIEKYFRIQTLEVS